MTPIQKQQPAAVPVLPVALVHEEHGGRPSLASLTARGADADRRIARVLPVPAAPPAVRTVTFNSSL
ncbi:hypothetical protein AB0M92_13820 [Streptomyces sp. NPDC051582]|uniref:hypothetical protein n=1 Tax=Streptomyces sp. NPDC051582 TaxID=3155167 RepID=UPI0034186185